MKTPQPIAALRALTPEAQIAAESAVVEITRFPFRVGRESRADERGFAGDDRRQSYAEPNNDLYLLESNDRLFVSREHFEIRFEDGEFFLVDRGSVLGTWVGGQRIGGNRTGGRTVLEPGDVIIIGSYKSGFIFQFIAEVPAKQHHEPLLELSKT